jgi:hypothetical protein
MDKVVRQGEARKSGSITGSACAAGAQGKLFREYPQAQRFIDRGFLVDA